MGDHKAKGEKRRAAGNGRKHAHGDGAGGLKLEGGRSAHEALSPVRAHDGGYLEDDEHVECVKGLSLSLGPCRHGVWD